MIKSTMVFQVACMQSAPASAYLNSGSITTGRQFTLLLKSTKSSFIQKQFLLHKCYKRSFRLPSSSGHAYVTSHTFISCSLKYPATDHWKAGTRASSCLSDNSWLSWKHRLPKESPTLLSLQSGFWRGWSCTELQPAHSEMWATAALMPCLCQCHTSCTGDTNKSTECCTPKK